MGKSRIEWTESTWNPIRARNVDTGRSGHYCVHVSEGCRNCYAERMQPRFGNPVQYRAQDRAKVELYLDRETLAAPLRWKKPRTVFVCSMTDLFLEHHPIEFLDRVFAVMALCPQHRFQVLTKRSGQMRQYVQQLDWSRVVDNCRGDDGVSFILGRTLHDLMRAFGMAERFSYDRDCKAVPLPNLWLGVSCEDQAAAEARLPDLLNTPAALRFVSAEPLLGPVDLTNIGGRRVDLHNALTGFLENDCDETGSSTFHDITAKLDWVICGGESGPARGLAGGAGKQNGARPMHPDWARSIRDQCVSARAGVGGAAGADKPAFFFKQWGAWVPALGVADADWIDPTTDINPACMKRVGKKRAGRMLDGRTWDEMP